MCRKIAFPDTKFTLEQLHGGLTNLAWKCKSEKAGKHGYTAALVKVFGEGTDLFINRKREEEVVKSLTALKAARVLGFFDNGRVEPWIEGEVLTQRDLLDKQILGKVAVKVRSLHDRSVKGTKQTVLWDTLDTYLQRALTVELPSPAAASLTALNLQQFVSEIAWAKKKIAALASPIVFNHGDLLGGNIVMQPNGDIALIDYEFSDYNYRGYDIGDFFNNFARGDDGLYGDFSLYPTPSLQEYFVTSYLGADATSDLVAKVVMEANQMSMISNL